MTELSSTFPIFSKSKSNSLSRRIHDTINCNSLLQSSSSWMLGPDGGGGHELMMGSIGLSSSALMNSATKVMMMLMDYILQASKKYLSLLIGDYPRKWMGKLHVNIASYIFLLRNQIPWFLDASFEWSKRIFMTLLVRVFFFSLLSRIVQNHPFLQHRQRQRQQRRRRRQYSIYVLQCQNDKYYVGCTNNLHRRIKEHLSSRGGSSWTRAHKPLKLVKVYNRIPQEYYLGKEAQVTAELMLTHGINNVRGAMFSETRDYSVGDIPALKGFLGHYNDMSYRRLDRRLQREFEILGSMDGGAVFRKDKRNDRCYRCGKLGHWARECPTVANSAAATAAIQKQ